MITVRVPVPVTPRNFRHRGYPVPELSFVNFNLEPPDSTVQTSDLGHPEPHLPVPEMAEDLNTLLLDSSFASRELRVLVQDVHEPLFCMNRSSRHVSLQGRSHGV